MSMIISGALCGLGGTVEGLGTFQNAFVTKFFISYRLEWYGRFPLSSQFTNWYSICCFLFGALQIGGVGMKPAAIPEEVVQIVTASIIFFVCAHYIIEKMISMRSAKKGGAN